LIFYKQDVTISDKMIITKDVIYFEAFYFTSYIISSNQIVWYHNDMITGLTTTQEGFLNKIENFNICNKKHAIAAIYSPKSYLLNYNFI